MPPSQARKKRSENPIAEGSTSSVPPRRVIRYSFWAQSSALLVKSLERLKRTSASSHFPSLLYVSNSVFQHANTRKIFLLTLTFDWILSLWPCSASNSWWTPLSQTRKADDGLLLSLALLYHPTRSYKCPRYQSIPIDTENGRIMIATHSQSEIGQYGGPALDPLSAALLPPDFVSPYNSTTPTGLLGNASTPLSAFLANVALTDSDGRIYYLCMSAPSFQYPIVSYVEDRKSIDGATYGRWGRENYMSSVDITSASMSNFKFDVFYNYSLTEGSDLPIFLNLISNALWRTLIGNPSMDSYLTNPGHRDYPRGRRDNSFDIVSLGCPNLYIYIFLLMLPITMENLVAEKETRLRETMRMMGLKTHVYFFSTYLWNYLMFILLAALALVIGAALGFAFWLDNNFLSYFVLLVLWGNTLISMAWLLSIFITSSRTAVVMGYAIILAFGILCTNLIRDIVLDEYTPARTLFGISIVPPLAFFRGLTLINNAIAWKGPGMSVRGIKDSGLADIYAFLAVEWIVCLVLAIYFELVLPIGPGAKKDPLFFLPRRFWIFKTDESKLVQKEKASLGGTTSSSSMEMDEVEDKPDDVLAEERRTLDSDDLVVKAFGLHKVFTRGKKTKVAVRHLTMGIRHGECFGFLGPNGAGKSTTISMLCGYLRPTSGNATINGLSIREDMDDIHLQMGVCPQDDALWPSLTGPEHLEFYGRLKNLSGKQLRQEIEFWLEQVNLHSKKTKVKSSSEYSGGMKRRLSVACAMIGNPSVVLLDEPTTGLDPASRIALWQVVQKFKSQCAMMLTTHSMEEAEALCDRLGIFVAGRLKTVGHASELKDRYGRFYKIQITTNTGADQAILDMLKELSPNTRLLNSLAGTNNIEAPSEDISLATLFDSIEKNRKALGITHWAVTNTTLEEVFLKVTANEVQDEALKFAKKKKQKKSSCCCPGGGDSDHVEHDAAVDVENQVEMSEDGANGFVADPKASEKRLDMAVNEMESDDDSEEEEITTDGDSEDLYEEDTSSESEH